MSAEPSPAPSRTSTLPRSSSSSSSSPSSLWSSWSMGRSNHMVWSSETTAPWVQLGQTFREGPSKTTLFIDLSIVYRRSKSRSFCVTLITYIQSSSSSSLWPLKPFLPSLFILFLLQETEPSDWSKWIVSGLCKKMTMSQINIDLNWAWFPKSKLKCISVTKPNGRKTPASTSPCATWKRCLSSTQNKGCFFSLVPPRKVPSTNKLI